MSILDQYLPRPVKIAIPDEKIIRVVRTDREDAYPGLCKRGAQRRENTDKRRIEGPMDFKASPPPLRFPTRWDVLLRQDQ